MRRITLWLLSTVAALVLLFSYRTSTMGVGGGSSTAAAAAPRSTDGSSSTDSGSGSGSTGSGSTGSGSTGSGSTGSGSGSTGSGSGSDSGSTSGTDSGGSTAKSGDGTYEGSVTQTRWGPIQVTITVADGKITDVAVPVYPDGNHRDVEINDYALPVLKQATLAAQSADIDSVSGATVTSDGYRESLQAAIDAAHL